MLTLLVISFDEIPEDFAAMVEAIKRIPAFAVSFWLLMMFWLQHRAWSRRYGLENARSLLLSLSLIFTVLVYVFPLRTVIASMFAQLTGGRLPADFSVNSWDELRGLFLFYSTGFIAMCGIMWLLVREALAAADDLLLCEEERVRTRRDRNVWALCVAIGFASILIASFAPDPWVPAAGYVFWIIAVALPLLGMRSRRRLARLDQVP